MDLRKTLKKEQVQEAATTPRAEIGAQERSFPLQG